MDNQQGKQATDANNSALSHAANSKAKGSSGQAGKRQSESGTKPAGENRGHGREGVDAPRTEQNRPAGKPAPQYDDRPGQQRGGSGDAPDPAAPLPDPRRPNYGDKEPGDPRRLDVDSARRDKSGDRKQPGSAEPRAKHEGGEKLGGRSDDSTPTTGSRGKND